MYYIITAMLSYIQKLCKDSDLLVIGNAQMADINPSDYICVRMNYGIRGGNTDIWVNNLYQAEGVHKKLSANQKVIMRLNGEKNGQRIRANYPKELHKQTYFWNVDEWLDATKEIGADRPLTGTLTLYWFLQYTEPNSITVTGMDFFKTKSLYAKTPLTKCHDVDKDKKWVLNKVSQGLIYLL